MSGDRGASPRATGRAAVAVPVQSRRRRGSGHEVDPSSFEAALSRSLPTITPELVLEPEMESAPALLRADSPHHPPAKRKPSTPEDDEEANQTDDETAVNTQQPATTEDSPLLARKPFAASLSSRSSTSTSREQSSPSSTGFLNNTSPTRFWLIFSQVLLTLFIACFDSTLLASSHPVITSYFGAAHAASWLSTSFLLTSTTFQPLLGRMSDGLGRKPLFVAALAVLTAGTAWCGLAGSIESFIVARAVCGLGAGGSTALGSIITSDLVPIERRGAYQSLINAVFGAASALGAALGGALAESIGWRWSFGIQVPALLFCVGISMVAIPNDIGIQGRPNASVWESLKAFDSKGSLLLTTTITFFILGLNLGGNILPWSHPFVIASLVISITAFPIFLWVEIRVEKPIMPPRLITRSPHANLIFANFIGTILANAIIFNMPLYFQAILLTSATSSGLNLVIPSIASSVVGTSTGFAITYTRRLKWPLVTATTFYVLGTLSLVLLNRHLPSPVYILALVPVSIGHGFMFPGTFMAVLASSKQAEQAVVTSTLLLWRSVGSVLGVATSSLIVQNALMHYLREFVHGDLRDEVIERVRESVEAVAKLEPPYREQVIESYAAALRLTFMFCVVVAVASVCLIFPVKLPRLPARR